MPRKPISTVMRIPRGYRSVEAAVFIAQMDDLTVRLVADVRGLSSRELQWQPGPGRNSIGMLLAHLAVVEVWWLGGPALGKTDVDFRRVIGIEADDDGMPAAPTARHPRTLRSKPLSFYLGLLRRSRAFVRRRAREMTAREMERPMKRFWKSQLVDHHFNIRWVLYHVLEHFGGHYGQILLLKELMRAKAPRRAKSGAATRRSSAGDRSTRGRAAAKRAKRSRS
ncbi:MAG: DUF664 domain-containing protein [Candidatus Eisenbacteria bacterium]